MDALMQQQHNHNSNENQNHHSFFPSDELGRANDFISSLTDNEISALNASYSNSSAPPPAVPSAGTVVASKLVVESQEDDDAYSQLFPLVSAATPSSSSAVQPPARTVSVSESSAAGGGGSNTNSAADPFLNWLPTPIGGSCQVVSTKDQVPLNQSLISQSNSLAEMFTYYSKQQQQQQENKFVNPSCSMDSLFPNLAASLAATTSTTTNNNNNKKIMEADFGIATSAAAASNSSPLIVAATAAACPTPRSNALQFTFTSAGGLSSSASSKLAAHTSALVAAAGMEQQQEQQQQHQDYTHQAQAQHNHHRSQQSTRWNERYQELILYKQEHGDCNVPYLWEKNRPLSEWVKRQRHQYKLKKESKHSALTDEREALLSNLGFVWNSRASLWDGRFQELCRYQQEFGNLKVSKRTSQHRALSVWLKRQRHACRLFLSGDPTTCMTEERMQKLLDLGVKIHKKP